MRSFCILLLTVFLVLGAFRLLSAQEVVKTAATSDIPSNPERELDSLCDCVRQRYTLLLEADLESLDVSNKGQWVKYLPNVGVTYDIQGRPRPAASINTSTIYTAKRDRQQLAAQREGIRKRLLLEEARTIGNLIRKYQRFIAEGDRVDRLSAIAEIDRELFYLYQEQHKNDELMPEEFLFKKKAFLIQEMRGLEQEEKVRMLRYEVEDLAQCLPVGQVDVSRKAILSR